MDTSISYSASVFIFLMPDIIQYLDYCRYTSDIDNEPGNSSNRPTFLP